MVVIKVEQLKEDNLRESVAILTWSPGLPDSPGGPAGPGRPYKKQN